MKIHSDHPLGEEEQEHKRTFKITTAQLASSSLQINPICSVVIECPIDDGAVAHLHNEQREDAKYQFCQGNHTKPEYQIIDNIVVVSKTASRKLDNIDNSVIDFAHDKL